METKWIWAAMTLLLGVFAAFGVGVAPAAPLGSITEYTGGTPCSVAPLASVCSGSLYAGGSPRSIAAGPDGNLWFNDQGATVKAIGRITPEGTITEFSGGSRCSSSAPVLPVCSGSLYAGSKPGDVVGGPDGNLWFADKGTIPAIGEITQSGTITEFSTGGLGAGPHGIAVGADGNVWFTDDSTPAIGRITPGGVITDFQAGLNPGSKPAGIAEGPDGNLWFADQGMIKAIGMITPAGVITEFPLPSSSLPADIAAGSDGSLWFTDQGTTRAIGRITTTGTVTEFSSGLNAGSVPNGIAAGADGNVWFVDKGTTPAIGEITPSGAITEFTIAVPGSSPRGIATGPDGNLWFSDDATSAAIGQFGVGAPAASVTAPVVTGSGGEGIPQTCGGDVWSSWAGEQPSRSAFGYDGYEWLLDGSPIAGADGTSYTPTIGDIGHELSCKATVTYTLFPVTVASTSAAVTVADLTPPVLSLPAPIMVGATDPHGATVSYSASATDNVDSSPVVSCTPTSGSTFPIGTTTVNCTAADASGNVAHGSFTVQVEGAAAQLADLDAAVEGVGPGDILALTVSGAQSQLAHGHPGAACLTLALFKLDVRLFTLLHLISAPQSASFIAQADTIGRVLGC